MDLPCRADKGISKRMNPCQKICEQLAKQFQPQRDKSKNIVPESAVLLIKHL